MVRSSAVALALLAGLTPAQPPAAPPAQASAAEAPPWANKLFLPDIGTRPDLQRRPAPPVILHGFGPVPKGTLCTHVFRLTNIYDFPLQVVDWNVGCKCLAAYPPQRLLDPAEAADFTVTLDTRLLDPGPASRTLRVAIQAGGGKFQETAVLRFEVDVRSEVQLAPGGLDFGTVAAGEGKSAGVLLTYQGKLAGWRPTGVKPGDAPLDAKLEDAGRNKFRLTATLRPNAPAGPVGGWVTLTTSDPALPVVQVPVRGEVLAAVKIVPEAGAVFPQPVKVGEKDEVAVLLRSSGRAFRVARVADPGDGVSAEVDGWAGPTQRVVVRFAPTRPGVIRKELRLETDLPGRPTVTVRVEATAAE